MMSIYLLHLSNLPEVHFLIQIKVSLVTKASVLSLVVGTDWLGAPLLASCRLQTNYNDCRGEDIE